MPVYSTPDEARAALMFHAEQIKRHLANHIAKMDNAQRIEFLEAYRGRHGTQAADEIKSRAREAYRALRRSVR